ncbi:MAG TPA: hypothetical protein ENJ29_10060 [Bacteroidetes bacterium]|nr:hypothetical protein [Bacteroidota bacterium]
MTEIAKTIELPIAPEQFWPLLDMREWPRISGLIEQAEPGSKRLKVGCTIRIVAGPGEEKVHYDAKITELVEAEKLAYERRGGPLPGTSKWQIDRTDTGCRVEYRNQFLHTLAEPIVESMTRTMEHFLSDLEQAARNGHKD